MLVLAGLIACAPPQKDNTGGETSSGVKVSEATSAADFGGMDALVEAAKKEGELNVIALRRFSGWPVRRPGCSHRAHR